MGGRRSSKQELIQLEAFVDEGLTTKQIAEKLGRSEAGIRNLCYRKKIIRKAEDETKLLLKQKDQLKEIVTNLQGNKNLLTQQINALNEEKEKLETILYLDKILLQQTLNQALVNLKQKRPDLFTLTNQDQIANLVGIFLKTILA